MSLNYDSDDEKRILGDDEYPEEGVKPTEGEEPVLEEGELTLDELENVGSSGNYKDLLDLLTAEQFQYVKASGILTLPEAQVRATLEQMISENKQKLGM